VDGVFEQDPKEHPRAALLREIGATELERRALPSLPFDRVLLKLLRTARLLKRFQVINGRRPELIERALNGEHVGTVVVADT
jgi:molybdenum storage protein